MIAFLPVGTHPDALALSQNQEYLLVVDSGSSDVAVIQKRTPSKKFEPSEYSLLTIIPVGMQPNQIVVKSFWRRSPRPRAVYRSTRSANSGCDWRYPLT